MEAIEYDGLGTGLTFGTDANSSTIDLAYTISPRITVKLWTQKNSPSPSTPNITSFLASSIWNF